MDISLRMWLFITIGVLILGILIDGIRRWRQHQRNPYRLALGSINIPEADDFRHVIPGPARPVDPAKLEALNQKNVFDHGDDLEEALDPEPEAQPTAKPEKSESFFSRNKKTAQSKEAAVEPAINADKKKKPVKTIRQEQLDLTESVPVLMDPVFTDSAQSPSETVEEDVQSSVLDNATPLFAETKPVVEEDEIDVDEDAEVEEAIVLNVFSREAAGFQGEALLSLLLESGLRYGDMSIFHRHQSPTGEGKVLFSVANAMKPGTFKIEAMNKFSTKGLSFFFGLPGPKKPVEAFDLMLETAQYLAKRLNGEVKDDKRSVLTAQTIEHYRARIRDFERRHLAQ